ncbi:helix-turn-helix transcriptional regulator [Kitasatospora sp. NBC_00240]|uniref:helix-turn-helix transcriptional regulator n=1 Tax=Kitasatospora sp. NBC_00240 TaxID=2903567 RepID=UPI00225508D6|nr:helix-turn-helix transcriptional regulator [Kitasatospora sp. NBC_00240]MCX5208128.1 helix-turn-helix transcriptional regulator [Kitasatospora sp. NBC_00240]
MDRRTEIRDFLTTRRARVTPEQAGRTLSPLSGTRRVPGLRREEVAQLAGVSVPYYTRLERGDARGATDAVLDAIARALLLDDAERAHLFDLVRAANATGPAGAARPARQPVRPGLRNLVETISDVPAYLRNARLDLLAGNPLARALFAPIFDSPARPANAARFTFLDPAAAAFYPDWETVAEQNVATLRAEVGRNPYDKALSDLIGELSTRGGDAFRGRWARHDVRHHRAGAKRIHHPLVGDLTFTYETTQLTADDGLYLILCAVPPGSRDAETLDLLASWNASAPTTSPSST